MQIKINLIKIGERHRKDMGDLNALANSIKELGQLQPIGVDSNYRLIFGERRIRACELLLQETVKGEIIHLDSILEGEYAENEVRKDFTISECVEIGKAIELGLGNRQGQRTDIELRQNFDEVKGKRTDQIAAEKSGLGNKETYRQAKKVINNGSPELIEKMDNKEISVSAAAKISGLDKDEQEEIIEEIEQGAKPAQAIKQKTEQGNNDESNEPDELYVPAARYFFAYPACSLVDVQKHFKITKKRTADLIKALEKNEVIYKPNEDGTRYLGLMPTYPEPTEKTEPGQVPNKPTPAPPIPETAAETKKNQNIANQFSSETNEWYTPNCIIEDVFQVLGDIDLDPCSDPNGNVAAKTVFTQQDDGLSKDWFGSVFMNPPYSGEALEWANKIISEPIDQAIVLVASNTDARYFHRLLDWCDAVCFVKGRLEFKPGIGQKGGRSTVRNVLFYKGNNNETFFDYFEKHGSVLCLT